MVEEKVIVNGVELDLPSMEVGIFLNFSIAEVREPGKIKSAYSKTVEFPGTKTNNKLFSHIFEVGYDISTTGTINFAPDFNPNLKADVTVLDHGIEVFKGIIKLDTISIDRDGLKYHCTLFGSLANFFYYLGDKKLEDLTSITSTHTYDKATQAASWSAAPSVLDYVYPMIYYGDHDESVWGVENFYPAFFIKKIFDAIFKEAGYVYESNFLNSNFFKRLITPINSNDFKLDEAEVVEELFSVRVGTTQENLLTFLPVGFFKVPFNVENSDPSNLFNNSTYEYSPLVKRLTSHKIKLRLQLRYEPDSSPDLVRILPMFTIKLMRIEEGKNYTDFARSESLNVLLDSVSPGDVSSIFDYEFATQPILFNPIATYYWMFIWQSNPSDRFSGGGDIYGRVLVDSTLDNEVSDYQIREGDTVTMSNLFSKDIKQKDFITSIFKLNHLFIDTDKSVDNKLYIEHRNDFYSAGVVDWSDRVDTLLPIEIIPMGDLDFRRYKFTYEEDKDFYNTLYKDRNDEVYGVKKVDIENDFLINEKETKVIFAPTPLAGNTISDRVIPHIYTMDEQGGKKKHTGKIRILYWSGLKNCGKWTHKGNDGETTKTQYPYAGHLDDPYDPTLDLNFGITKELFYSGSSKAINFTNNNRYNADYKQYVEEVTDRNSKIIRLFLKLYPSDILNIDFRKIYYLNNQKLRLNKISNYRVSKGVSTECEFVKIKNATPFTSTTGTIINSIKHTIADEILPTLFINTKYGGNTFGYNPTQQVNGEGNNVDETAHNIQVTGKDNYILGGAENITLLNTSGITVMNDVSNVMVLNSSGIVVDESNVVYINNIAYPYADTTGTTTDNRRLLNPHLFEDFTNGSTESGEIGDRGWATVNATITHTSTVGTGRCGIIRMIGSTTIGLLSRLQAPSTSNLDLFTFKDVDYIEGAIRTTLNSPPIGFKFVIGIMERGDIEITGSSLNAFAGILINSGESVFHFITADGAGSFDDSTFGTISSTDYLYFKIKRNTDGSWSCFYGEKSTDELTEIKHTSALPPDASGCTTVIQQVKGTQDPFTDIDFFNVYLKNLDR